MMKILIRFKLVIALLVMPITVIGSVKPEVAKTTKEKQITKSFNVNSNATLKIDNSYGNIDIVTWNQNRIEFDITIKVTGNNTENVENKLNEIDVKFSASNEWVAAETLFRMKKNSWWNWGKSNNLKVEVNYRVRLPMTNNVKLNNDYGSINLDTLEGRAEINCDYGKITTKELMAENNVLNFDYTNSSYFEYINSGKISADYSSYTIGKTKSLSINADYTKSIIETAEDISYNCDYGSLKVDNVNKVTGNGDYLTLRMGNVYKNLSLKADYGSIKIDRVASNAGNIEIQSDFTGITIGYDSEYHFNFNIKLEYASLRNSDDFDFNIKRIKSSEKYYEGFYGSSNTSNLVKIDSEYGSVTFKKQ